MKFSFSIHFLGWWLTGENWLASGQFNLKPSISYFPESPITLGGYINIHCQTNSYAMKRIVLYKKEAQFVPLSQKLTEEVAATFHITIAHVTNGGLYACIYCGRICSPLSDTVKIFITGQLKVVPSLSETPSTVVTVGEDTTLSCKSYLHPNAKFHLYKDKSLSHLAAMKEEQNEAAFFIANATVLDGGIYQCKYCVSTKFSELCSYYSNSKQVFVRDPFLLKPSIKAFPGQEVTPGLNITIECQGPENNLNVSLYKSSILIASQITEPDSNRTRFFLSMINFNDTGNYTCQYHERTRPFVLSPLSDPLKIVVRGTDHGTLDKTIIQVGAAIGCLFLVLLLLGFVLYRERKKGLIVSKRPQQLPAKETNTPLEPEAEDFGGVSYAELKLQAPNKKQIANPSSIPESCVYASVANDRTRKGQ